MRTALQYIINCLYITLLCFLSASCNGKYDSCAETSEQSPNIFPDYKDVTVPKNIAPLNFNVNNASHIKAIISLDGKQIIRVDGKREIQIPQKEWKEAMQKSAGKSLDVEVSVWNDSKPNGIAYKPFKIYVSNDKIDTWIAYRLIPPGFELWNKMGIYQRCLEDFNQKAVVTNAQNNRGCVNCHSFCNYSPKNWLFHARGEGGGTMLTIDGTTRKIAFDKIGPQKSATYPYWHPSGQYIAFSSNVTRQNFYGISQNKIEVFDTSSDLIIYDTRHNKVITDKRFCDSPDWETFPAFSPDGKFLYLCVAHLNLSEQQRQTMMQYFEKMKYALIRIPFDAATGTLGKEVDTIYSPSRQGGSVSFPRVSPDGRFLMFTEAQCATFPIQHKEADLKAIDISTNKYLNTDILNSDCSDSYHAWSSNARWIVFSSRRTDGKYTRLFFAHCDSKGNFSKPFMLPQKTPDHIRNLMYAYNIPEFVNGKIEADKEQMAEMFQTK